MWQVLVLSECFVTARNAHNGGTMACHDGVILAQPAGVVLSEFRSLPLLHCSGEGGKK